MTTTRNFSADPQPTGPRCAQCGRVLSDADRAVQTGQFNCCAECRGPGPLERAARRSRDRAGVASPVGLGKPADDLGDNAR